MSKMAYLKMKGNNQLNTLKEILLATLSINPDSARQLVQVMTRKFSLRQVSGQSSAEQVSDAFDQVFIDPYFNEQKA